MARFDRLPISAYLLVLSLALLTAALLAAPAPSFAAQKSGAKVHILFPKDGSRPGKPRIVAKVKVKGPNFKAFLNGRNVTKRFGGGKVRKATFRRGKDYKVGQGDLFVVAGKGVRPATDQTYFTASKRQDSLLKVRRVAKPNFLLPRFHIRAKRQLRTSKVWLNGKNVRGHFDEHDDLRGIVGQLGGATSIRHGKNKLRVKVLQQDGRFADKTLRFRIPLTRPIASAGPDQRVGVGDAINLDASDSRKPKTGEGANGPLETSWKVVSAPPSSTAAVDTPNTVKTSFTPDVAGTYRLQVVVTSAGGTRSVDEVTGDVPQVVTPMGLPIQTITSNGGIQIGDPDQAGAGSYPKFTNWLQMLVLDPDTATPQGGQWDGIKGAVHKAPGVMGFNQGSGNALLSAVQKTQFGQLVVISGQDSNVTLSSNAKKKLGQAINYLGGTFDSAGTTPQGTANLADGRWSLIGHQGLTEGQAYQNAFVDQPGIPGFLDNSAGQAGSLNGYLQSGMNSIGYQFVSPAAVPIDTKWTPNLSTPPSPAQNTILVGDTKYESTNIATNPSVIGCPCSVGVQVLVLDQGFLTAIGQGTFGILTMDGGTNDAGIAQLNQMLNQYVNNHGAGSSSLVVVQDFGHWGNANSPSNSANWIQDSLPDNSYTPKWKGNSFPTGSKLSSTWNNTVAGNLGRLAGYEAHDIAANYRRPVFDSNQNRVVPRTWGGMTVVGSTNAFQWSSAYAAGQGDHAPLSNNPLLDNGRTTGALMQNEQSQWEMSGATKGAGYPGAINTSDPNSPDNSFESAALPELVYAPQTSWPCSVETPAPCPGSPAEVQSAMRYISNMLPLAGNSTDVRDSYLSDDIVWGDLRLDLTEISCAGQPGISEPVCSALKTELSNEFEDLDQVKSSFITLTGILNDSNKNVKLNLKGVAGQVTSAVAKARKDLLKQESSVDIAGPIADAIYVSSDVLELSLMAGVAPEELEFAPAEMSMTASLLDLGMSLFPFFQQNKPSGQDQVQNDTNQINDRTSNLARDLEYQLTATNGTLRHFHDLIRTDPVKLHTAALNFGSKWDLDTKSEQRLAQSISIGASQSLYEAVMPVAFTQWVMSPRNTSLNGSGVLDLPDRGYNCSYLDGDGNYAGINNPLVNEPASMSGMTSVAWAANYGPNGQGHTVRALKLRDDDMKIESAQASVENGDNYLEHKGATTPASLLDPLFEPPSDLVSPTLPNAMGMDKDDFFGQGGWTMKKLQCGFARN